MLHLHASEISLRSGRLSRAPFLAQAMGLLGRFCFLACLLSRVRDSETKTTVLT